MGGGHLVYRFESCSQTADGVLWSDPLHAAAGALSLPTVPSPPTKPHAQTPHARARNAHVTPRNPHARHQHTAHETLEAESRLVRISRAPILCVRVVFAEPAHSHELLLDFTEAKHRLRDTS